MSRSYCPPPKDQFSNLLLWSLIVIKVLKRAHLHEVLHVVVLAEATEPILQEAVVTLLPCWASCCGGHWMHALVQWHCCAEALQDSDVPSWGHRLGTLVATSGQLHCWRCNGLVHFLLIIPWSSASLTVLLLLYFPSCGCLEIKLWQPTEDCNGNIKHLYS